MKNNYHNVVLNYHTVRDKDMEVFMIKKGKIPSVWTLSDNKNASNST